MPLPYVNLAKSIALRANQLGDAEDAVDLNTAYRDSDLVDIMDGMEIPYAALREDILVVEAEIATMIGFSSEATLRAALATKAYVKSGDALPTLDERSRRFLGKPDGLFNVKSGLPLQLMDKQTVLRRMRNSGSFYKIKHDIYCIEGTIVIYDCGKSRSVCGCSCQASACSCAAGRAELRGVAWSRSYAESSFDAFKSSVLPIEAGLLFRNMVLANISQENWFTGEAQNYGQLAIQSARNIGLDYNAPALTDVVATNTENTNVQSHNR